MIVHNVLVAKEADEKRTLDNEKEECKKLKMPEISEGDGSPTTEGW